MGLAHRKAAWSRLLQASDRSGMWIRSDGLAFEARERGALKELERERRTGWGGGGGGIAETAALHVEETWSVCRGRGWWVEEAGLVSPPPPRFPSLEISATGPAGPADSNLIRLAIGNSESKTEPRPAAPGRVQAG
jgi:hypothetical protein